MNGLVQNVEAPLTVCGTTEAREVGCKSASYFTNESLKCPLIRRSFNLACYTSRQVAPNKLSSYRLKLVIKTLSEKINTAQMTG